MNERHVLTADGAVDAEPQGAIRRVAGDASSALGIPGTPEDQAFAMLYLASDASRFVTGVGAAPQRRRRDALVGEAESKNW